MRTKDAIINDALSRVPKPIRFIGRQVDLDVLDDWRSRNGRLLSLVGPPGIGKTALARHFADRVSGVRWYSLAEARDEEGVCNVICPGVEPGQRISRVAERLSCRSGLVVLDNCEQATEHVARCVSAWLDLLPEVAFLVTSRERLNLLPEQVHEVSPLTLPHCSSQDPMGEAMQLWESHVAASRSGYCLTDGEFAVVSEIVRRLDGIPLAIELAAAQHKLLSSASLLERLKNGFDVLRSTRRDAPRRHETLLDAVVWSFELLKPDEKAALAALGVFAGDFSVEAAEDVLSGGRPLELLAGLREKSLLQGVRAGGEVRVSMLAIVRDVARRSCDSPHAPERHAAHYDRIADRLSTPYHEVSSTSLEKLALERLNLFEAARYSLSTDIPRCLRILIALHPLVRIRGPHQAYLDLLDRAIRASSHTTPQLNARALCARGELRRVVGNNSEAIEDLVTAKAIAASVDDHSLIADILCQLGTAHFQRRELDLAEKLFEELRLAGRSHGSQLHEAIALGRLGLVAQVRGRRTEALEFHGSALSIHRETTNALQIGLELANLGVMGLEAGDLEDAARDLQEALEVHHELGIPSLSAHSTAILAMLAHDLGDTKLALTRYAEAISIFRELGDSRSTGTFLVFRAAALLEVGDLDEAQRTLLDAGPRLDGRGLEGYSALSKALLATARASQGRLREAEELHKQAMGIVQDRSELGLIDSIRVEHVHLWLAQGRAGKADGTLARAEEALATGWAAQKRTPSSMLRISLRRAQQTVEAQRAYLSPETIVIQAHGEWFSRRGRRTSLHHRPVLRRALVCLSARRIAEPGVLVSTDRLIVAIWPGERIFRKSALNRLHVTIARLRKLGLGPALLGGRSGGYRLDSEIPVRLEP